MPINFKCVNDLSLGRHINSRIAVPPALETNFYVESGSLDHMCGRYFSGQKYVSKQKLPEMIKNLFIDLRFPNRVPGTERLLL